MQRSHCENENVQFVQELAEVDGPFESPIDINFRNLTKIDLPPLVWNRNECSPKKMKLTNTGHTVIVSGKWKCERPYLTGGPLLGKYVFSQIHFHWGHTECNGSEHLVSGEGFPLEMHVAHFKTEYVTQENALREKDGMVIVVYLFKLQEEPNIGLKRLINSLPLVRQPSTSRPLESRPIITFCNPFTDDYFMYWGSVVTSTCAHILLWIVCREPFGISRDQVSEFRKILDSKQQPICRNSRDTQPLHKRNVFHVNPSKNLSEPLLNIKKMMRCYCKGSDDNDCGTDCGCQSIRNQEDFEGSCANTCLFPNYPPGTKITDWRTCNTGFRINQSVYFHSATIETSPILLKQFSSDRLRSFYVSDNLQLPELEESSKKVISHSCCFLPVNKIKLKPRPEKRKPRKKNKNLDSINALTHILNSLEAIKNHTFKKLKEIESINEEIRGIKSCCSGTEDKKWLKTIEKIMKRQKKFTISTSQGCFNEIKKLAKDCNFDKFIDNKSIPMGDFDHQMVWVNVDKSLEPVIPEIQVNLKESQDKTIDNLLTPYLNESKVMKFSNKAQKLLQSFFEDIKECEGIQKTVEKDIELKKISSLRNKQAGDSLPVESISKTFITQKMFNLENLEDRFFAEVTIEDSIKKFESNANVNDNPILKENESSNEVFDFKNLKVDHFDTSIANQNEKIIPLHKANITVLLTPKEEKEETNEGLLQNDDNLNLLYTNNPNDINSGFGDVTTKLCVPNKSENSYNKDSESIFKKEENTENSQSKKRDSKKIMINLRDSVSNVTAHSSKTQEMIIAKVHRNKNLKCVFPTSKTSSKGTLSNKKHKNKNINLEGYYIKKKKRKSKKKIHKGKKKKEISSSNESLISMESYALYKNKTKWKKLAKTKFKLEIEKTSTSSLDSSLEYFLSSPERKKLKLEAKKNVELEENLSNNELTKINSNSNLLNKVEGKTKILTVEEMCNEESLEKAPECAQKLSKIFKIQNFSSSISENPKNSNEIFKTKEPESNTSCLKSDFSKQSAVEEQVDYLPFAKVKIQQPEKDFLQTQRVPFKNKSLSNLSKPRSINTEISQRIFVENLKERQKNARESFELFQKEGSKKPIQETPEINSKVNQEVSNVVHKEPSKENDLEEVIESPKLPVYEVGYLMTTPSPVAEEIIPKLKREDIKPLMGDSEPPDKMKMEKKSFSNEKIEKSIPTESKFSSIEPKENLENDPQSTVSCSKIMKAPQSKPHSAENIITNATTFKKKIKKRPHCCKRSSRHYLKKNIPSVRKPSKVESRPIKFLERADEEQIKIISENLARYLKEKLIENTKNVEVEKKENTIEKETFVIQNENPLEGNQLQIQSNVVVPNTTQSDKKQEEIKKENTAKTSEIKTPKNITRIPKKTENKKPVSPEKRVNNFIQLNKVLAGKYRRLPQVDKAMENQETKKEVKKCLDKSKNLKKQKEKSTVRPNVQKDTNLKSGHFLKPCEKGSSLNKASKQLSEKSLNNKRFKNSKFGKTEKSVISAKAGNTNDAKLGDEKDESSKSVLTLQKIPQIKKRWIPAYMLTSYIQNPVEVIENQQRKINRYMFNIQKSTYSSILDFYEKKKTEATNDSILSNDLEYLIKLQMCLNNDVPANQENSTNFIKTFLSQEYTETATILEKPTTTKSENTDILDPPNKNIFLFGMNDILEHSSSSSDNLEDSKKDKNLSKKVTQKESSQIIKESGDSEIMYARMEEADEQEDNSESSYNCEISITLNSGSNDGETDVYNSLSCMGEFNNSCLFEAGKDSSSTQLERGISTLSIVSKQRKKRKENEISTEMKQKLLEILEGEIKREMGLSYGISSDNSSERLTLKLEDSDTMSKSQSSKSSCDNLDVLTQISETMRQYLSNLKQESLIKKNKKETKEKEDDP